MLKRKGFTLVELMCGLSVSAILFFVAVPSIGLMINAQKQRSTYERLFSLIYYTRLKATFEIYNTILCPSANQTDCINDWQQPLMVFTDINNNKRRDTDEKIDRIEAIGNVNYLIYWRASGSSRYLRYTRNGSTSYQNGTFTLCPKVVDVKHIRKIIIYRTGRARYGRRHEIHAGDCI
ncbi:MAG: type IV fimbrial biogenesis protein FimT [Candidatus Endobugula sp.]|jgi:type IV fimbrial biogenesis protein FimT